jgi:hypothetical protein
MIRNWIYEDNLHPFLTVLSWIVEYAFDPDEWMAIRFGIEETNDERNVWYDYEFSGKTSAQFRIAREPGGSVVHLQIKVPESLSSEVKLTMQMFSTFHIEKRSSVGQTS